MGIKSGVSWTNASHGFWYGCKKVSPGCKNCYAETQMKRFGKDFNKTVRAKGFNKPLTWKDPQKIFVCPQSDFFIEDADPWRDEAWDIIKKTPHLTYQILTKRPDNIKSRLPEGWPFENVWLGVTAENQEQVINRVPILLEIKAFIRFVSIEPMLTKIDITDFIGEVNGCSVYCNGFKNMCRAQSGDCRQAYQNFRGLDWVICGGESGNNFRTMEYLWAKDLHDQCVEYNVPFFMKQMSAVNPKKMFIPGPINKQLFPEM